MKIMSVRHAVPSCVVTNEEVVRRVTLASNGAMQHGGAPRVEARIRDFLNRAGTLTRNTLGADETAIQILRSAVDQALKAANVKATDLDFIIYAGVSRGWLEPSMASLVQREISANNAACFDVMEACASWMRAMQVARALCVSGTYGLGMIVNCECATADLAPWHLDSEDDLERSLAAYTIGEAATATVVSGEAGSDLYVTMRSFGEHCDLCMIPLANAGSFLDSFDDVRHAPNRFYSNSDQLFKSTIRYLWDTYSSDPVLSVRQHDLFVSHAASAKAGEFVARKLGASDQRWYCTHARYGNTVAASVPLGMSCAIDDGLLHRGTRILAIVGSAGISVGFLSITF